MIGSKKIKIYFVNDRNIKIDPTHAVVSCDDTSFYQHYWPVVKKCWQRIGIIPIRVMVRKDWFKPHIIREDNSILVFLPCGNKYSTSTYAQFARLWYLASEYPDENDVIITSDMDMLPVSKNKLITQFKHIPNNEYVYFDNVDYFYPGNSPKRLSMCYNISTAKTYNKLFSNTLHHNRFVDDVNDIVDFEISKDPDVWRADEHYLTRMALNNDIVIIQRKIGKNGYRPDRLEGRDRFQYDNKELNIPPYIDRLKSDEIIDIHCKRPYDDNIDHIKSLVNIIFNL